MFGCWETLYVIKQAMEEAATRGRTTAPSCIEATEAMTNVRRRQRTPAGRQDLQRQDPPVLRPPEHLPGEGRQAARWYIAPPSRRASTSPTATTPRWRSDPFDALIMAGLVRPSLFPGDGASAPHLLLAASRRPGRPRPCWRSPRSACRWSSGSCASSTSRMASSSCSAPCSPGACRQLFARPSCNRLRRGPGRQPACGRRDRASSPSGSPAAAQL